MKEAGEGGMNREHSRAYEGEKVSHHYPSSFPRSSISKEVDRHLLAGRTATLVLLVGQNLSMICRSPKQTAGSLA